MVSPSRQRMFVPLAAVGLLLFGLLASMAQGAPPYQTIQRVPTAPQGSAKCTSRPMPLPVQGYSYGYFGAQRNTSWQRSFGVGRTYTQWSRW